MSKETAFYPRLRALTDEWMDLFGYWAPTVVTDTADEYRDLLQGSKPGYSYSRIDNPTALPLLCELVRLLERALDTGDDLLEALDAIKGP